MGIKTLYYYHHGNHLRRIDSYLGDSLHGECKLYFFTGEIRQLEQYQFNKRTGCKGYTIAGEDTACFEREIMPHYPGGEQALLAFISNNVRYPKKALRKGLTGRVIVSFVIEKDGSISDVHVVSKNTDPILNAEAIRVVQQISGWSPGYQDGIAVKVKMSVPINFKITQ